MNHEYRFAERVFYVGFDDKPDENDPGLITRVIDDETVMVLWLRNHEVGEHHVSVIAPARQTPVIDPAVPRLAPWEAGYRE